MHPETELIPFLRGELEPADHERVAGHVAACAECRRAIEESRIVLDALAARRAAPPPVDWGRYQAEVRARAAAGRRRRWWARPVPTVAVAAMLTAGVLLGVHGLRRVTEERRPAEVVAMDEAALGAQLPMLREYRVVERLDMLEDLEVIRQLDSLNGAH
jgi:predicted anti-sigma-YlaC factor YlaD